MTAPSDGRWRRRLAWARKLEMAAMLPFLAVCFIKQGTNLAAGALFVVLTSNLLSYLVTVLHIGHWGIPARLEPNYVPQGKGVWALAEIPFSVTILSTFVVVFAIFLLVVGR
jgi:hypothetical protein